MTDAERDLEADAGFLPAAIDEDGPEMLYGRAVDDRDPGRFSNADLRTIVRSLREDDRIMVNGSARTFAVTGRRRGLKDKQWIVLLRGPENHARIHVGDTARRPPVFYIGCSGDEGHAPVTWIGVRGGTGTEVVTDTSAEEYLDLLDAEVIR